MNKEDDTANNTNQLSEQETNKGKIYSIIGVGVVVISFSGILIKLSTTPPLVTAFYRMLISSLVLTPILLVKYRRQLKSFLDYRIASVGFFLAIHFYFWFTAFEYTNVANAVIFIALQPLFTYLLEYLFAKEDLRPGVMGGIVLAFIGSIIICIGDLDILLDKVWGDLLALVSAFFAAVYLFRGRKLRNKLEYLPYLYIIYTYAALFLGLFALITGEPFSGFANVNYLYFVGLALGPTLIGHSAMNYSVRHIPTTIVSLAILVEPVLTTIFAWLLLGESITIMTFIGGLFIMGGIYKAIKKKESI